MPGASGLLAAGTYPAVDGALVDERAETQIADLIAAVTAVRAWRESTDAPPGKTVLAARVPAAYGDVGHLIARLARLDLAAPADGDPSAAVAVPGGTVDIHAADLVDPEAEAAKLQARRDVLAAEISRAEGKLANGGFVAKAPPALVESERAEAAGAARRAGGARVTASAAPEGREWTIAQAEDYLLGLELFGMRFGLDRMRRLLTALDTPQKRFASVHVVGTAIRN